MAKRTAYAGVQDIDVSRDVGTLRRGTHTVRVRCIDSAMNIGPPSTETIRVTSTGGAEPSPILFITLTSAIDTLEQRWMDWLDAHESEAVMNWTYDHATVSEVLSGTVNLSAHDTVLMADSGNTQSAFYAILADYADQGGVIIILGEGMKFALDEMGYSTKGGSSKATNYLWVDSNHYITEPYVVGQQYQVGTGNDPIYHNSDYVGMGVVSIPGVCFCCTCEGETNDTCVDAEGGGNLDFYIPLEASSSGLYPSSGTSSDTVTVTSSNPLW